MEKSFNTDLTQRDLQVLQKKLPILENEVRILKEKCQFRLVNISHDDKMVAFYTGFPSFATMKACFKYLGTSCKSFISQKN